MVATRNRQLKANSADEARWKSMQKPGLKPEGATLAKPVRLIERLSRVKATGDGGTAVKGSRDWEVPKGTGA